MNTWNTQAAPTSTLPAEDSPFQVLSDMAEAIENDTDGLLQGHVRTTSSGLDAFTCSNAFGPIHSLYIIAPYLGNYMYKLMEVNQVTTRNYPVGARLCLPEQDIEAASALLNSKMLRNQLIAWAQHEQTGAILSDLLGQSRAVANKA